MTAFMNPANAGCGFQVADVGLHGTDEQRAVRRASRSVGRRGGVGPRSGRPHRGPRAVRFQVVHVLRLHPGARKRRQDHPRLGVSARHGEAWTGAVLVDGGAAYNGPDAVTVAFGFRETFQDHQPAALPADVAVGTGVERLALPVRGQHAGVAAEFQEPAREDVVHAPPPGPGRLSPRCSPETAWWIATSADEHAVSTAMAGPARSSANATRPIAVLSDVPLTA